MSCRFRLLATMLVVAAANLVAQNTATPVQYLVVIFQENVSFDHYFATYPVATNPDDEPAFPARTSAPAPLVEAYPRLAGVTRAEEPPLFKTVS